MSAGHQRQLSEAYETVGGIPIPLCDDNRFCNARALFVKHFRPERQTDAKPGRDRS